MRRTPITRLILCVPAALMCLAGAAWTQDKPKNIAERLGYPADAKLLIIHADDVGLAKSVNQATFKALEERSATSASIMVPCPWLTEVAAWAKQHPDADLGLHLTLNAEWKNYRWGPVSSTDKVRGLLDPNGYLWNSVPAVVQHASPEEVESEIREQVKRAIAAGIQPTHLDTHMGTLAASPAFYGALVKVAREYKVPFLALRMPNAPAQMLSLPRAGGPGPGRAGHGERTRAGGALARVLPRADSFAEARPHGVDRPPRV